MGIPLGLNALFVAMESTERGESESELINDTVDDTNDIDEVIELVEDEDTDEFGGKTTFSEKEAREIEKFLDSMPENISTLGASGEDEEVTDVAELDAQLEAFNRGEYYDYY